MNSIPPVTIDFQVRGLTDVSKAFESVEQRIARMEKNSTAKAVSESRVRIRTAKSETDQREKEAKRLEAEMEKIRRRSSEMAGKYAAKQVADEKRAENDKAKAVERAEAEKTRLRDRAARIAGQIAAKQAAQEIRTAEQAAARSQSAWARVGRRAGGVMTGTMGRLAGGAMGAASMALGIGGGALVADAVHREAAAERSASLLVNQVTVGGKPPAGASVGAILGQASQLSKETGISKEELIEGTRAYAKTARGGDFHGAMANMGFFAKLAKTTGVDMGEIAGAAGMLQSQNAALAADPNKMQQMLLDVYAQTKSGSLGMTEIISQMGRMGSVRGAFQGDESANQRKLMALGQLVAPAAGAESGVMIADLALEATRGKHLARAKAAGVKFDARNRIESPEQMISAVLKSTNGDIGQIGEIFGQRGGTLLRELATGYTAARDKGGKGAAGIAAGDAYLKETIGSVTSSTMTSNDLSAQFDQMMATPAARFERAMNQVIDTLEDKAEPYMERFADKLPELLPKFEAIITEAGRLAEWFADNPLKGAGAIALAAISKDLLGAGIGAAVKAILAGLLTGEGVAGASGKAISAATGIAGGLGGAMTAPIGKLAGGLGGKLLTAGSAIGAFAVGASIGYVASDALLDYQHGNQTSGANADLAATNQALALGAKARQGRVTTKDIQDAQRTADSVAEKAKEGNSWFADSNAEAKNAAATLKLLNDTIKAATTSLRTLSGAAHEATNGVKGNPARSTPINERNPTGS